MLCKTVLTYTRVKNLNISQFYKRNTSVSDSLCIWIWKTLHWELLLRVEALKLRSLNHDLRSAVNFSERPNELTSGWSEQPLNRKMLQSTCSDYCGQHNLKYASNLLCGSFKNEFFAIFHTWKALVFTYCRRIKCCKATLATDITKLRSRKRGFLLFN